MNLKFLKQDSTDDLQSYIKIDGSRMVFATFAEYQENNHRSMLFPGEDENVKTWLEAEPVLAALSTDKPDQVFHFWNVGFQLVNQLPSDSNGRQGKLFIFLGAIVVNLASDKWGDDELTDCSLFDVLGDKTSTPISFVDRLEHTRASKIAYSARFRSHHGFIHTLANVFFPYAPDSFEDAEHIGVSYGKYRPLGTQPPFGEDGPAIPGTKLVDSVYQAVPKQGVYQVKPNESVDVGFDLVWPASVDYDKSGGERMTMPIEVVADSRMGYLPYRKKLTNNGEVSFTFSALGLKPGDFARVKIGVGFVSKIGEAVIEVVDA